MEATGPPPRPPHILTGPPPGTMILPQNVGQSWWSFVTMLETGVEWLGWRDLADAPSDQPVADVMVYARCRGDAIETDIIAYDEYQDVTRLAEDLLERWPGGRPDRPSGPGDPAGPFAGTGPGGLFIEGRFLRRSGNSVPHSSGWADGATIGYFFSPGAIPLPDDPGPTVPSEPAFAVTS